MRGFVGEFILIIDCQFVLIMSTCLARGDGIFLLTWGQRE